MSDAAIIYLIAVVAFSLGFVAGAAWRALNHGDDK